MRLKISDIWPISDLVVQNQRNQVSEITGVSKMAKMGSFAFLHDSHILFLKSIVKKVSKNPIKKGKRKWVPKK